MTSLGRRSVIASGCAAVAVAGVISTVPFILSAGDDASPRQPAVDRPTVGSTVGVDDLPVCGDGLATPTPDPDGRLVLTCLEPGSGKPERLPPLEGESLKSGQVE